MRLALLLLVLTATPAAAQPFDPHALTFVFGSGPGLGRTYHWGGLVTHQRGNVVWTAQLASHRLRRTVVAEEFLQDADAFDTALLVGRAVRLHQRLDANASAGIAAVHVWRTEPTCRYSDSDPYGRSCMPFQGTAPASGWAIGLPLNAGVHADVGWGLGVGLRAFANLNAEASYSGVAVDLRIQPLQPRR